MGKILKFKKIESYTVHTLLVGNLYMKREYFILSIELS